MSDHYYTRPTEYLVVSWVPGTGDEERIVGVAHWIRNYSVTPHGTLKDRTMLKVVEAYNHAENIIWPNRAVDCDHDSIVAAGTPFFEHHWTGSRADSWHLSLIGVHPGNEKSGHGRQLVRWGFEKSRAEGVSCSVIAVPHQERFYQACGFNKVVGTTNDEGGDANPWRAAGLEAAPIMFCDHGVEPTGMKGYVAAT